ncbi:MAG: hypothetical protein Q8N05_16625 [Bacteroidota bacterium]|nr:hypothetical protein [Bacteroidota bacterium]
MTKQDKEIIRRISKIKSQVPSFWIDVVAAELGKTTTTCYAYARGTRGIREGYHKDIFRILLRIEAQENEKTTKLLLTPKP